MIGIDLVRPVGRSLVPLLMSAALSQALGAPMIIGAPPFDDDNGSNHVLFDFDEPPDAKYRITDKLRFGAELTLDFKLDRNFDLESSDNDDRSSLEPEFETVFAYEPTDNLQFLLDLELSKRYFLDRRRRPRRPQTELKVKQLYTLLRDVADGMTFQIGRQSFEDERRTLFDDELDAFRLFYRLMDVGFEASVSREKLVDENIIGSDRNDPINNYYVRARYVLQKDVEFSGYALYRDDLTARRDSPLFLGLRSIGEPTKRFEYWIDAVHLRGHNGTEDLRAFAFDIGGTYKPKAPLRPSLTLGLAFGSGDSRPNDGVDHNYRQTGFHENTGRFNGVTSFNTYGETIEPELSNMWIATAGIGIRPTRRSSIDLVYHYYRQHKASDDLRDTNIREDPSGLDRDLGHGIDLVIGVSEFKRLKFEAIFGMFIPGRAFPDNFDEAYFGGIEVRFEF